MHESLAFVSSCPKCEHRRSQRGFSRAALLRLLKGDYPIEAYCAMCDEFWAIGPTERAAIAGELNGQGAAAHSSHEATERSS